MQFNKTFLALMAAVGTVSAFNGDATFFNPGLGACGKVNTGSDFIAALSTAQYGNGSNCNRNIKVNYNGKSVIAKVVDKCPGCATNDVDLSPAAFSALANTGLGRIKVSWNFV